MPNKSDSVFFKVVWQ